jgi:ubiquinone/menaquinone biosynthesis C-methylase UbiE
LAHVRAIVGDAPVGRGLDVACGTGMSSVALAQFADQVVGIDASPAMLHAARRAANVAYVQAGAESLPFPDARFDAVTCCSGVHWFDQARFFAELRRVLQPDGWVGLYDHYYLGEMVDVPEFKEWTRAALAEFPLPERSHMVGDPRAETPAGFTKVGDEFFADDIELSHEAFADYQVTISNFVAATEPGTPRAQVRDWLLATTAPFYDGVASRTVRFLGSVTCLRPLAG